MRFSSYKQTSLSGEWDAIVIGSGIGGLAAAAVLAKHASKKVLVLERHYEAGGYTHTFHRPGYEWDVGVHYIGQVHDRSFVVRRAFDYLTDSRLEWSRMPDVYDRVKLADRTYEFPSGLEQFRKRMCTYFPGERAAIDRYLKAVRSSNRGSTLYWAEKAVPTPIAAAIGPLLRWPFLRWAGQTTGTVLDAFTSNRELKGVLAAQWGDYGLPPSESSFGVHAMVAEHYFEGACYPVGGSSRIADSIARVIEAAGGQIVVSAEVEQVLMEGGRSRGVRMADGRELRAATVISDAGARNTLERLLPGLDSRLDRMRGEVRSIAPSTAHVSLYVGLKQTAGQLGLDGTNLWIYPSLDHDHNVRQFRADPSAPFAGLYISFPSAKDPDFERRHPGMATIEVVAFMPYDRFRGWQDTSWRKRGDAYEAYKSALTSRLQAELERHVPAVAGKIDYAELSTPLSTRHFMNYGEGEAFGLASTPDRYRARSLAPRTPVGGLYLTGQDVTSLGVTGALFGGVLTASVVLGRNLMPIVTAE